MKFRLILISIFYFTILSEGYSQPNSFRIIGYVPNWIDVNAFSKSFDFKQVTHLNFAFQNPDANGNLFESNAGLTTLVAKAHQNNVKVLVSIGGGAAAEGTVKTNFQKLISTSEKRATFIQTIVSYLKTYQLDGLDVDEEGPAIDSNYGAFIKQLADTLKPQGYLLTTAVGWGSEKIPNSAFQYFDWVNLMAYDITGSWDLTRPGQHSPYSYAQKMISDFKKRGVKKEQLCLGVPFYGYGFYKIPGSYSYSAIIKKYPDAWQKDQVGDTIYYNGMSTIWKKTKLAFSDISGIMIWELSNDVKDDKSLLKVISLTVDSLKTTSANLIKSEEILIYPNPADKELAINHFALSQKHSIEIFNMQGSRMKSIRHNNIPEQLTRIDISSLHQGSYICQIISEGGVYTKLFVKN